MFFSDAYRLYRHSPEKHFPLSLKRISLLRERAMKRPPGSEDQNHVFREIEEWILKYEETVFAEEEIGKRTRINIMLSLSRLAIAACFDCEHSSTVLENQRDKYFRQINSLYHKTGAQK